MSNINHTTYTLPELQDIAASGDWTTEQLACLVCLCYHDEDNTDEETPRGLLIPLEELGNIVDALASRSWEHIGTPVRNAAPEDIVKALTIAVGGTPDPSHSELGAFWCALNHGFRVGMFTTENDYRACGFAASSWSEVQLAANILIAHEGLESLMTQTISAETRRTEQLEPKPVMTAEAEADLARTIADSAKKVQADAAEQSIS